MSRCLSVCLWCTRHLDVVDDESVYKEASRSQGRKRRRRSEVTFAPVHEHRVSSDSSYRSDLLEGRQTELYVKSVVIYIGETSTS